MDNTPDKTPDKKEPDTPAEKLLKAKSEVFKNLKHIADITQSLFSNTGFRDQDFLGYTDERGFSEAKWKGEDLTALVLTKDLPLLDQRKKKIEGQGYLIPTPPKIGVSQAKNIDTLLYMLQQENWKREKNGEAKKVELEFAFKDYAKVRGYTDEQIARGGKFLDELKRDLISGSITSYILDLEAMTGCKRYLIQNFYGLEVPKAKSKEKWRVIFNEPYKTFILQDRQYYPILLEAIQDKNTDDRKGYLYFFYKLVIRYASTGDFKTQLKVSTLLDKIKISDDTKKRPKESFRVLCECIYYTATHYNAIKEVRFFESVKCEMVKVIKDLEKFKSWSYTDFIQEVLTPLGLTDIRDALISFKTPPEERALMREMCGGIITHLAGKYAF